MASLHLLPPRDPAPSALHSRAADNLRFIRETMEAAASFTAISGPGLILMGLTACLAAPVAALQPTSGRWLLVWIAEAILALGIAAWTISRRAQGAGLPLLAGPARRCLINFVPPVAASVVLTAALYRGGLYAVIPGTWLLLYGVGAMTGGAFTIRLVRLMGFCFAVLGTAAL